MAAYEAALSTSRPWAPWYAIPADDKPHMRACVAKIFAQTLGSLDLRYPVPSADKLEQLRQAKIVLTSNNDK